MIKNKISISYQYGFDEGSITIEQNGCEVEVSKKVGLKNENIRATSFRAFNVEQAKNWFNLLQNNPDFAKNLIF